MLSVFTVLNASAGAFAFASGAQLASVLLILFMSLLAAAVVMATTLLVTTVPNELRGLCMSLSVTINVFLAIGLAPPIVSSLSSAMGGPTQISAALGTVVHHNNAACGAGIRHAA